jgi:hypothetical protein
MYVNFIKRKEVKNMKYETPEVTALTPAINAIQGVGKTIYEPSDGQHEPDGVSAYQDWE